MSDVLQQISSAVIDGRVQDINQLTRLALDGGLTAKTILDHGLLPGMEEVGGQFRQGKKFVPEVLLAARSMQTALDILRPLMVESGVKLAGRVVIGTVKGDLHDIGKNLVGMMLEGAGFEVIDLGRDVAPEKFVQAVRLQAPDLIGMSALLTTTMRGMGQTVNLLQEAGLRQNVKVLIGGAPVTTEYARQIGADAYAPNAPAAAEIARELLRL